MRNKYYIVNVPPWGKDYSMTPECQSGQGIILKKRNHADECLHLYGLCFRV